MAAYSPSARIATLTQPVGGFTNIVLPTDAVLVKGTGAQAVPGDLLPSAMVLGAMVEATGRPSTIAGTLVARRLVLL